jgi:lipoprotein-releasing system ATP-binding protein
MSNILLTGCDIHKNYRSGTKAVKALSALTVEFARGKSASITGPSGAGKSTLLHVLGGLDRPTSGSVRLDGKDLYRLSDGERASIRNSRIGFVFQFYHLLPEFSAMENVMLPALMSKDRCAVRRAVSKRAEDILASVGLAGRMTHKPSELSGGESQRVAIARSLINEPDILLCDEPTGNLDSSTSESIYALLFDIKAKRGMTLIIVSHDETLQQRTDMSVRIRDGRIV